MSHQWTARQPQKHAVPSKVAMSRPTRYKARNHRTDRCVQARTSIREGFRLHEGKEESGQASSTPALPVRQSRRTRIGRRGYDRP